MIHNTAVAQFQVHFMFISTCKQMDFARFHNYEKIRQLIKRALQAFFTFLADITALHYRLQIEATIHQA